MAMDILNNIRIQDMIAHGSRTAGQTTLNGAAVDMSSFRTVAAIIQLGAITTNAVTSLHWEGSDDNSTWVDLEGTEVTIEDDDDNDYFATELKYPRHRYNRCVMSRATQNSALRSAHYIMCGSRHAPVDHPTDVNADHIFVSPGAGTP